MRGFNFILAIVILVLAVTVVSLENKIEKLEYENWKLKEELNATIRIYREATDTIMAVYFGAENRKINETKLKEAFPNTYDELIETAKLWGFD